MYKLHVFNVIIITIHFQNLFYLELHTAFADNVRNRRADIVNYGQSQIAFASHLSSHAKGLGVHQVVPFDNVTLNAGNAFDPVTHVFLCPVTGVYVFQSSLMAEQHDMIQTAIVIDGANGAKLYASGADSARAGSGLGYDQGFNSLVTLCKQGQHVWVRNHHANGHAVYPAHFSTFSGFMLYEVETSVPTIVG